MGSDMCIVTSPLHILRVIMTSAIFMLIKYVILHIVMFQAAR